MVYQRRDVKSIFDEAAEMARPEDRAAYLEIACGGDADLRNRVEALLRVLDGAGDFLERAPALDTAGATEDHGESPSATSPGGRAEVTGQPAWVGPPAEGPATMIGPYKLLQQIAHIGVVQCRMSRLAEAEASHERARVIRERLARDHPKVAQFQFDLAATNHDIGILRAQMGSQEEAIAAYERARAIRERLEPDSASDTEHQIDLVWTHTNIGFLQRRMSRLAEAKMSYERARAIRELLASQNPGSAEFAGDLADSLNAIAEIDLDEHRLDKARAEILEAVNWRRKVLAARPGDNGARQRLSYGLTLLIQVARELGHIDEASEAMRERDALRD